MPKKAVLTTIYPDRGRPVSRRDPDECCVVVHAEQEKGTLRVRLRVGKNGAISLTVGEGTFGSDRCVYRGRVLTDREYGIDGIGAILGGR